jgi:hypothetical protein
MESGGVIDDTVGRIHARGPGVGTASHDRSESNPDPGDARDAAAAEVPKSA